MANLTRQVAHSWILQANPKLYDIDAALKVRPVIYWRVPQYTDQLKAGDRALLWRAGQQAGFVGWGVFRTDPQRYDLTKDDDPFVRGDLRQPKDYYAPLSVWRADEISKPEVSEVLPEHRIVIAPMGTVFPLGNESLAALQPLLMARGYDLAREGADTFTPLPVLPANGAESKQKITVQVARAKITPALFLLSSTPERPVEVTIEGDALRLLLVERDALKALDEAWDSVGVYLLFGRSVSDDAVLSVYVGKAQGLRTRIKTGHAAKDWTRCLLIQREGRHAFNASDISWLERRLIDILLEAPTVDLVNKAPPPPEFVPEYKADILERTVLAALGILGVLGAYVT